MRIVNAARVARTFRIDPVLVLDADLPTELVRIACHEVVQTDRRAEAARNKPRRGARSK